MPKSKTPQFKRAGESKDKTDITGKVIIKVLLEDPELKGHRHMKGNLNKSIAIESATVSSVVDAIEQALLG
jgi:hypothetical protein